MTVKKTIYVSLIFFMLNTILGLNFVTDGVSDYVIVTAENAHEYEQFAAQELRDYLNKISGAKLSIVSEQKAAGRFKCIYVGNTLFSQQNGIKIGQLSREEWIIRSVKDSLILTGWPRVGVLYAVYEFLEKHLGCHWLDPDTEYIRKSNTIRIDGVNERGKPAFLTRTIYTQYQYQGNDKNEKYALFLTRNKASGGKYTGDAIGSPGSCHTFRYYAPSAEYFNQKPEFFSMNEKGVRVTNNQLCLSSAALTAEVIKKLRGYIKIDRDKCTKEGHNNFPIIYDISQEDTGSYFCKCTSCSEIVNKENESGLLISFINKVAAAIAVEYPDILVQTFAYNFSLLPPKTIKARDNVIIQYCDPYKISDLTRPVDHEFNVYSLEHIKNWSKAAQNIALWDYWRTFWPVGSHINMPYHNASAIHTDLKIFQQHGVKSFFTEMENWRPGKGMTAGSILSFYALRTWLGYQLMQNPEKNYDFLFNTFFTGYYGPAEKKMKEYFEFLQKSQWTVNENIAKVQNMKYQFITADFVNTSEAILKAAETESGNDRRIAHIRDEQAILDNATLYLWKELNELGKINTVRAVIAERFRSNRIQYAQRYWSHRIEEIKKDLDVELVLLGARDYPSPEDLPKLKYEKIVNFYAHHFSKPYLTPAYGAEITDDGESLAGMAAVYRGKEAGDHNKPLVVGAGQTKGFRVQKSLAQVSLPQDEKYHLYHIGTAPFYSDIMVWVTSGWTINAQAGSIYGPSEQEQNSQWEVCVSLKATGPAYVENSKQKNGIWVDRIIFLKPEKGQKFAIGSTLLNVKQIPEKISDEGFKEVHQFDNKYFLTSYVKPDRGLYIVRDKESAVGAGYKYTGVAEGDHKTSVAFGTFDPRNNKEIEKREFPDDEKYHLYALGKVTLTEKTSVFFCWHQTMKVYVNELFDLKNEDNDWTIYVSVKLTGPHYVPDSERENAVWVDRVFLCR